MPQNKVTWCNLICVTASLSQVDTWHWPSPRYTLRHTHTGELATNTEPISMIRSYVTGSDVNVTYTGTLVKLGPASIDTLFQSYRFGMEVKVTYKTLVSRKKLCIKLLILSNQSTLVTHLFAWPECSGQPKLGDQITLVTQNWVTRALWSPKKMSNQSTLAT